MRLQCSRYLLDLLFGNYSSITIWRQDLNWVVNNRSSKLLLRRFQDRSSSTAHSGTFYQFITQYLVNTDGQVSRQCQPHMCEGPIGCPSLEKYPNGTDEPIFTQIDVITFPFGLQHTSQALPSVRLVEGHWCALLCMFVHTQPLQEGRLRNSYQTVTYLILRTT